MKILMLNSVVEPRSTGLIFTELYQTFKSEGHDVELCYGRGSSTCQKYKKIASIVEVYLHAFLARITGMQGYFSPISTRNFIKKLDEFKPDVVVIGNIHGYYVNFVEVLRELKKRKILTYYYMFDEYAFCGKCCFFGDCNKYLTECFECPEISDYPKSWFLDTSKKIYNDKMDVYNGFERLRLIGAKYTAKLAIKSALVTTNNLIVYDYGYGLDTHKNFVPMDADDLRSKYGIPKDNVIILAVAPFSNIRKGIKEYFYKLPKMVNNNRYSFVHVGFDGKKEDIPDDVIVVPYVSSQTDLAKFFSMADLFLIPSSSEGFPTVCTNSLSCGTPICGFNISGTPHVACEPFGIFVTPFDVNALADVVRKTEKKTKATIEGCRKYAEENLDCNVINKRVLKQIECDLHYYSRYN